MTEESTIADELSGLDDAPVGTELTRADHLLLFALGLLVPAILLVWGWL